MLQDLQLTALYHISAYKASWRWTSVTEWMRIRDRIAGETESRGKQMG
jgi:hypothetical protein